MALFRVGEVGRKFRYATGGYVMSGSTGLELKFTKPSGGTLSKTQASSNAVTAPATALTNDTYLGNQAANTYMEFSSVAADFDEKGEWEVCGIYTDGLLTLHGSKVAFTVNEACA